MLHLIVGLVYAAPKHLALVHAAASPTWDAMEGGPRTKAWVLELGCDRTSCWGYGDVVSPRGLDEWWSGLSAAVSSGGRTWSIRGSGLSCPSGASVKALTVRRRGGAYEVSGCGAPFLARSWVGSAAWREGYQERLVSTVLAKTHLATTNCSPFQFECDPERIGVVCEMTPGVVILWPDALGGDWKVRVAGSDIPDFTLAHCGDDGDVPGGCFQRDRTDDQAAYGCRRDEELR